MTDETLAAITARVRGFQRSPDEASFLIKMDARSLLAEVEAWREVGRRFITGFASSLPADNAGEAYCPWCNWTIIGGPDTHEETCLSTQARALLGDERGGHDRTP